MADPNEGVGRLRGAQGQPARPPDDLYAEQLQDQLNKLRDIRREEIERFKQGKITAEQLEEEVSAYERQIAEIKRIKTLTAQMPGIAGKMVDKWKSANEQADDMIGRVKKLGIDLSAGPIAGAVIYALRMLDAQRVTQGFVQHSMKNFGALTKGMKGMGAEVKSSFLKDFMTPGKENWLNVAFITDSQRQEFVKSMFNTGLQIRNISGTALQHVQERMLVLANAFGMSTDDIVGKLNTFNDIFRFSTQAASMEIEKLTSLALKLGVAPTKFLNMVQSLTSQFKLQRIQIHEISDVYSAYYKNLNLGAEVTEALTTKTVSALGELKEGRIAAYLSITKQLSGAALGTQLVKFYGKSSTDQTGVRLALVNETLNKLRTQFASGLKNEFAQVRLVMETFGIQDMETGTRLWQVVDKMQRQGVDSTKAVEEARAILADTTGAEQMFTNVVINAVNNIMKYLGLITGVLGGKNVSNAIKAVQGPWNNLMTGLGKQQNVILSSISDDALQTNTSLEAIQNIAAKSYAKLTQSVTLQGMQIQATQAQALVAAAAAATPSGAAAAGAALAKNFVMSKMAQQGEMIVKLVPAGGLEDLVAIQKDMSNASIVNNVKTV